MHGEVMNSNYYCLGCIAFEQYDECPYEGDLEKCVKFANVEGE